MSQTYSHYTKARIGWFPFGLTGWHVGVIAAASLPVFIAINRQAWTAALTATALAAFVTVAVALPVRGRSAAGWLVAASRYALGMLTGWSRYRSRAASGQPGDGIDLPGSLAGVEIHDGPPNGLSGNRIAIIQHHTRRCWALTAALTHPGIGLREPEERDRMAAGLTALLDQAGRTELIDTILFQVRTTGEDGADRDQWIATHRSPAPTRTAAAGIARVVNDELHAALTGASVRTETFVTFTVPDQRLTKAAKGAGRGIHARARILYTLAAEVETALKAGLGASSVTWLTSPELAAACRTGFAPGDRAGIIDALTAAGHDRAVNATIPWELAGPSGADTAVRHYSHDAWNSISATIRLPLRGAVTGALAPVLTPTGPGERRCLLVAYPILEPGRAGRVAASSQWGADMGQALREKAGIRATTRVRDDAARTAALETKLARGAAITRPWAIATVTVPKTVRASEAGRRLDASIRAAGFAPLRLDLAQDLAFAATTTPLGVTLTSRP